MGRQRVARARTRASEADRRGTTGTVALLGDSICTSPFNGWLDAANETLGTGRFALIGVAAGGGEDLVRIARRVPKLIRRRTRPDFCIVQGGGNDIRGGGVDVPLLQARLVAIYDQLAVAGVRPIATTILPGVPEPNRVNRPRYAEINAWMRSYCVAQRIPLCDWVSAVTLTGDAERLDPTLAVDDYHPNHAGQMQMAATLGPVLSALIEAGPD